MRALVMTLCLILVNSCGSRSQTSDWYLVHETAHNDGSWESASYIDAARIQRVNGRVRRAWIDQYWDQWREVSVLSLIEFNCASGEMTTLQNDTYGSDGQSLGSMPVGSDRYVSPGSRADYWLRFVCGPTSARADDFFRRLPRSMTPLEHVRTLRERQS